MPEPLITDETEDVAQHAETADSLSLAFLVLLESLSPIERAVFLLREVFGYGYDEIARVVGKSEDNCRQIAVRARRQVEARKPRFEASRQRKEELARRFFAAAAGGRYGRTARPARRRRRRVRGRRRQGTRVPAAGLRPRAVARLFGALRNRAVQQQVTTFRSATINGQPDAVFYDSDGLPVVVVSLDIADDHVQAIRAVSNPE